MDRQVRMASINYDEVAVMDEDTKGESRNNSGTIFGMIERSPLSKTRSLSDGGGTQLSPSPHILEASRRTSKDDTDSSLSLTKDKIQDIPAIAPTPVTPRRPEFPMRGLSLQMSQCDSVSPSQTPNQVKLAPLSPKLDHSQIYASPTNILPRRSRGLDFSRAATSLHHSTLAEQSSPDSSPTIGGRAMSIPRRGNGEFGQEQSVNSLWSMMGNHERMNISSSVGSTNPIASDSSSTSGDDDFMDEEMEDAIYSTPQISKNSQPLGNLMSSTSNNVVPWMPGSSSAINSLQSFRTRPRKHPRRKLRGPTGLGFSTASPAAFSKSPPNNIAKEIRDVPIPHARRESISWAANQLHISSSENEEKSMETGEALSRDGPRGVVKRAVTRRGSLLPKTKGFARIRAALAEESTPVDSEVRREAEVIRQVRESDMDLEPRIPPGPTPALDIPNLSTAQSSPNLNTAQESLDDIPEDDMMTDSGLSGSFKQQAMKNLKKNFFETFSETGSVGGNRVTPPPSYFMPRGSSAGMSEDINMDSPSLSAGSSNVNPFNLGPISGMTIGGPGSESQKSDTPQPVSAPLSQGGSIPPTAAEITRRINNKRRRDDDFDPHSFKRRAVSPGMNSVHNSPITQSPLQRDMPWGSRPGSNHGGDKASGTPSENGSAGGNGRPINGAKGRVGFQGMVDTNDGLMRMSIE
ncbi:uncharacterized protein GGS22DRAFT_90361 [Annulohypoxylon maeteangense]|uniref:uncharacterized protein n=1 Tax=Annulohypoxylon maeteangense TaxID=1927788 RepID=UPI002007F2E2|nr:uncharacterized protein GGS22DRAFT_90361 [Annulohypoxylon maeteangense]KAI0887901.1 hypothetical protein GGS22DRAFT_90361 [Annulohypoxylon maeteangense]